MGRLAVAVDEPGVELGPDLVEQLAAAAKEAAAAAVVAVSRRAWPSSVRAVATS